MIAKLVLGNEIHLYKGTISLAPIKNYCKTTFKALRKEETSLFLSLYYIDEEGDKISLSSEEDCSILMETAQKAIIKIYIQTEESQTNQFEVLDPEKQSRFMLHDAIKQIQSEEEQIPALLQRRNYADGIRTVTLVQFQEEELIEEQISIFMQETQEKLLAKMYEIQEELIVREVKSFIGLSIQEISSKLAKQQTAQKVENTDRKRRTKKSMHADFKIYSQKVINDLVEERVEMLVPQLVSRVTKAVQAKLLFDGSISKELSTIPNPQARKIRYHDL